MDSGKRIPIVITAAIALLLQLLVAPYIVVGSAVPDLLAVAVMLVAVSRGRNFGSIVPFIAGFVYDIAVGGPVGAMAFTLLLTSFIASRAFSALNNDTAFIPILIALAGLLALEAIYGCLLLVMGYDGGLIAALAHRALPTFAYDGILAIIFYVPVSRLLADHEPIQSSITRLR